MSFFKDISEITLPNTFHSVSDIYIPAQNDIGGTIFFPGVKSLNDYPELTDIVQHLKLACGEQKDKIDFSIQLKHEEIKIMYRVHKIFSMEGVVYCLRKLSNNIPDIHQLGYTENYTELLITEKINTGGLILMCGETGQGKTTTTAAAIVYRLKKYGAFCLTIEDPIEMPLHGFYDGPDGKKGMCIQTEVGEEGMEEAIKGALRSYPSVQNSVLFLGEIRSASMANEVLKIAANGHLVFSTLHGFDLVSSLQRFVDMATSHKNTKREEVISMLALVFRLAVHQRLHPAINGKRKVDPRVLFSPGPVSTVANRIKTGNLQMLSTDIEMQNMALKQGKSIVHNS